MCAFLGIGVSMVFICALTVLYLNMVASWSLLYVADSLKFTLPWATCGNRWNTAGELSMCKRARLSAHAAFRLYGVEQRCE